MALISALPPGVLPAAYRPHALHGEGCVWVEKNCYVDIWIALTHALGLEPRAMLGFTAALDFLGDQWAFFKPPHDELRSLFGIDVQELNPWRPLQEHALEHLGAGRLISVEADAFWLPDTAGTDYGHQHTKTTIVMAAVDVQAARLAYFHNTGLHWLEGADYAQTMANGGLPVPLFAEVLSLQRLVHRSDADLRHAAAALLKKHLAWRPAGNPIQRFGERFATELPQLQARGLAHYHAWAFANIRQLGAAMELLAEHLRWLGGHDVAAEEFLALAQACKTLILKAARAVNSGRAFDASEAFSAMAGAWERGMQQVSAAA